MIDFLFTVVVFVLVLSLLVLVHELGHFWVARGLGIQVRELGIGFPPRLAAFKRGGIDYSLNWLPFGGFVRLHGEEDPEEPRGFAGKSIRVRTAVIVAGSVMNLVLAWVIFSFIAALPFQTATGDVVVQGIAIGSPAEAVGLKPGDVIDAVDEVSIESTFDLAMVVHESGGNPVTLRVIRDGSMVAVPVVPRTDYPANQGPIGVEVTLENRVITDERIPLWTAPIEGLRTGLAIMGFVGDEVGRWIQGSAKPELAGPVGIAQVTGETARTGLLPLIQLMGLLSLNLGILNLLPIPALDGGRLPFLLLEGIRRGRRVSPRREGLVHFVGFAILIGFVLVITFGVDIPRIMRGDELLP